MTEEKDKSFLPILTNIMSNMIMSDHTPGIHIPSCIKKLSKITGDEYDEESYKFTYLDWMKINGVDENSGIKRVIEFVLANMAIVGGEHSAQSFKVLSMICESNSTESKSKLDAFLDGGEVSIDDLLK